MLAPEAIPASGQALPLVALCVVGILFGGCSTAGTSASPRTSTPISSAASPGSVGPRDPSELASILSGPASVGVDRCEWGSQPSMSQWCQRAQQGRGANSVVFGTVAASTLTRYLGYADRAVQQLTETWPQRGDSRPLTIVAPATSAEFAMIVGRVDPGRDDQVAALTDGPLGLDGRAFDDRIIVNPSAFSRLTEPGQQFVITHEAVHVVLRRQRAGSPPRWLSEGLADWMAAAGSGRSPEELATDALSQVRITGPPRSLPVAADFDPATTTIALAYQRSWVLVTLLIDTYGLPRVLDFLEAATVSGDDRRAEAAADRAFETVLNTTRPVVTAAYAQRLVDLSTVP